MPTALRRMSSMWTETQVFNHISKNNSNDGSKERVVLMIDLRMTQVITFLRTTQMADLKKVVLMIDITMTKGSMVFIRRKV